MSGGPPALAARLLAALPARPRLLLSEPQDPTALVAIATLARGPQRWLIADRDEAHINALFDGLAKWAQQVGLTATWPARALLIHAPGGAWRIEGFPGDPAELMACHAVEAVIADRPDDTAAVWRAYRKPRGKPWLLAWRCPTGRIDWHPSHPSDALLRPPTPARRPDRIVSDLRAAGCTVASAVSDWRVPASALALVRTLVREAAAAAGPGAAIAAWETARLQQTLAARLGVHIYTRDILARPEGE